MRALAMLLALMCAPLPARAADPITAQVTAIATPAIESGEIVGMVVGVVDAKGVTRVVRLGHVALGDPRAPDGQTLFEIGSASKVFTSVLLADFVERKLVSLDDPIRKYLPSSVKVPSHGGREITLAHLATHTSGLPRMPANFAPKDAKNPYADYTPDQLYAFLSSHKLARDPGAVYEYSNLGAGLLGHILTLVGKQSYDTLVQSRISGPLGLKSTKVRLSAEERTRLAEGHDEAGNAVGPWDFAVLAGAGGIRSTVEDLLIFVRANLGQLPSPLSAALARTHVPLHDAEGVPGAIGLGWHVRDLGRTVWHNGQTAGFHSYLAFDPQKQLGVVLLANSATGVVDGIGYRLLRSLAGEPAPPAPVPAPVRPTVALTPAQLDALVGVYELSPSFAIEIKREGDHLVGQATGQPPFRLFSSSPTHFFLRAVAAEIDFAKDELVLHQNGRDQRGTRRK